MASSTSSTSSSSSASSSSSSSQSSSGQFAISLFTVSTSNNLEIAAYRDRTNQYEMTLLDAEDDLFVFESSNIIRVLIGKGGSNVALDVNSKTRTANGSYVTNANPTVLVLAKQDMTFAPGVYDLELLVMDDATAKSVSSIKKGCFILHDTMPGSLTL